MVTQALPRPRAAPLFDRRYSPTNWEDAEVVHFTDAAFTIETKKPIERNEMDEIVQWVEEQKNPIQVEPYISVKYKVAKVSVKSSRPFNWYEYTFYMVPTIDSKSLEVLLNKSRQQMGWFHTIINYVGDKPQLFHNVWYTGRLKPVDDDPDSPSLGSNTDSNASPESSSTEQGAEATTENRMMEMRWTTQKQPEGKWTTVAPRLGDDNDSDTPQNMTQASNNSTEEMLTVTDSSASETVPTMAVAETINPEVVTEMITTMKIEVTTSDNIKDEELTTMEKIESTTLEQEISTIIKNETDTQSTIKPEITSEPTTTSTTPLPTTTVQNDDGTTTLPVSTTDNVNHESTDVTTNEPNTTELVTEDDRDEVTTTTELVTSTQETTTAASASTSIPPTVLPIV